MHLLHDPAVSSDIRARIARLTPQSERRWGKMSVDQMLWHVNQALANGLGHYAPKEVRIPLPKAMMRFAVLKMPWGHGAKTVAEMKAVATYSFDAERDRCLALIDEFIARDIDAPNWGRSAVLGDLSGRHWSELQAKHLYHHLKQFGL